MLVDAKILTDNSDHFYGMSETRRKIEAIRLTVVEWVSTSIGPAGQHHTWRVRVNESELTALSLIAASIDTKYHEQLLKKSEALKLEIQDLEAKLHKKRQALIDCIEDLE